MGDKLQEYYSSVCRTCLQSNVEMRNLSALIGDHFRNGNEKISYMNCLQYCLAVEDDVGGVVGIMPKQICVDCASALQVSYWFMKNASKAQELLKVRIKELQDKQKQIQRQVAVEEQKKPKRYRCKICNTKLETKRSLKDHVKLHLDIIAYNCQLCAFEHHQRNYLIEHYQLQHGVEATPEQLKPKTKTTPPTKRKAPTTSSAAIQFKNFVAEQQQQHLQQQQQQQHQHPYEVFMEPLPSQNSNDMVYTTQQLQQQQQNQNFVYTTNSTVNAAVVTTPLDGNATTTTIYAQPNGETFTFNTFEGDLNVQNDVNVGNEFIVMADGTVENVLGKGVVIEYINAGDDGSLALGNGLVLDNILQVQNADATNMILAPQQNDIVQMDVDDLIIEDPQNSPEQTQDVPSPVDEDMIPATFIEQQPKRNNCKICAKEFDTQDELKNHMLTHNEIPHFFCDHCTFYTFFKIDLHQHYKSKHNLQPTNKQLQPRNKQQRQHNSETDMDPQTKNAIVQKIERYARSQRLVYCCDICLYECDLKYDIRRHYLTKHRMHVQDIQQIPSRTSKNIQPIANKQAAAHGDVQKTRAIVNIDTTEEPTPDYPNGLNCRKCNEVFYIRNKLYEHYKLHDAEEEALKQQRQVVRVQKQALNNIPQQLLQIQQQEPEIQLQTQEQQQPEMQLLQQPEIQLQLQQQQEQGMHLQLQQQQEPQMQLQLQQQHSELQLQPEMQLQQQQLPEIQLQLQLEQQPEMHLQLQQQLQPEMQSQLQQQQQPEMQIQLQQQAEMQLQPQPDIQLQLQPQLEEHAQQQQLQVLQQLPQPHQEVVITTTPVDNPLQTFNNVNVDPMSLVLSQNNNTINNTAPLTPSSSSTYTLPSDAIPQIVEMEQTIETDMDFDFNGDALFEDFDDVDVENESEDNDLRNIVLTSDDDFDDMLKEQSETQAHTTSSYCAQCQKTFLSQYQFENHMFLHRGLAPYRCEMCTNLYNTKRALIRHYNAVHKKVPSRDMIQAKGDKVYVYDKSPTDILNIEQSKAVTLMCAKCTYESTDFPSVQLHLNTNHSIHEDSYIMKKLPFECPRCIRSFATKAKLVRHLERNHAATPINHPQIHINSSDTATTTTTTTTAPSLNNNVNMMQMNATCDQKGFTDEYEGQRHMDIEAETCPTEPTKTSQTNYNSIVPIEQCIAPSSFVMASLHGHTSPNTTTTENNTDLNISPSTSTSTINTELDSSYSSDPQSAPVTTDAVLYKCQKCHMTCTTIDAVRQHSKIAQCRDLIKLSNKDHPLFQCEICNRKYPTMYQLRFHLKRHMTRPFNCPCCPKAYVNKVELETHQRTHTNERPHKCDKCPNSFRYPHHLKRHKDIIHFGKRYMCQEANCNRQFTTLDQLKIHKWSHYGIVPYKCKYCERLFKKRLLLRKHCWKFHKRYLTDDEMAQNFRNSVGYTKAAPFDADEPTSSNSSQQ